MSEIKFFWKGILSQWAETPFSDPATVDENDEPIVFCCAEQYMMYRKAKLFRDDEIAKLILATSSPKTMQELGRAVKNFDPLTWDAVKQAIVYHANYFKFRQNQAARDVLLQTGEKVLAEASPYDLVWGIGYAEDNPLAKNIDNWKGKNLLGKILMLVRIEIQNENY